MKMYWLIRNSIDFRWIFPYVVHLCSRLGIDTVYVDVSVLDWRLEEMQPTLQSNCTVNFVFINSKISSDFFSSRFISIAIFEWGTGLPRGFLKAVRLFSRSTPEEKYRKKVLSLMGKCEKVVKIALPHGYNVKTNLVTRAGIKAKFVAPFKLARDRNFFDMYGYDTEFHKERLIKSGIIESRLIKVPPLFAMQSWHGAVSGPKLGNLFVFPKLNNNISFKELVSLIKSIQGDDLFITLHPRQRDAQLEFLICNGIRFNKDLIELGHDPISILSKFSSVYDVGSSVGLFAAFAGCDYVLLKSATANRTLFELGAFYSGEPVQRLSNEVLVSYIRFFHSEACVECEVDHFVKTVKAALQG